MAGTTNRTRFFVRIGILIAMGLVLRYHLLQVSIFPPADFLKYDPADIPALLAGFAMGPLAGFIVEIGKNLLAMAVGMAPGGIVGEAANTLAGGVYVIVASIIYWRRKTRAQAVGSMVVATAAAALIMAIANYYIFLPLWGIPMSQLKHYAISFILPFNLLKFAISSVLTFLLYKRVRHYLG
ncbi:MAG TPA: ECF transporter S component [Bacillota bacterium]|jgi:riboflavin transporter FmnP